MSNNIPAEYDMWKILGLTSTRDPLRIRGAYLTQLLETHPQEHPEQFHILREAYEDALDFILGENNPDFSLLDLYTDPEQDPAPITPTFRSLEASPAKSNETESLKVLEIRAAHWVQKIIERLSYENQQSASHFLDQILRQPELNDYITRSLFERLLLKSLALVVPFPTTLATHCRELFNWETRLKQPHDCYLAAVEFLIHREYAYNRIEKLESLGAKQLTGSGRIARALLSDFDPIRFWLLSLRPGALTQARAQLKELEGISAQMLPYMLDPRTIAWWRRAAVKPGVEISHYLAAITVSSTILLLAWLLDRAFKSDLLLQVSKIAATGAVVFLLVLFFVFSNKKKRKIPTTKPIQLKPEKQKKLTPYDDEDDEDGEDTSATPISRYYLLTMALVLSALYLSLATTAPYRALFAAIGYLGLIFISGASLFMYIAFAAMFIHFIVESKGWLREWVEQFTVQTNFQTYTIYFMYILAVYLLLNIIAQSLCRLFRYPFGIANLRFTNQALYDLILVSGTLVVTVLILTTQQ